MWPPSGHHAALRDQRREAGHVFGDRSHDLIGKTRVIETFERIVQKTVPQQRMAQKQRALSGCDLEGRLGHRDSLEAQCVQPPAGVFRGWPLGHMRCQPLPLDPQTTGGHLLIDPPPE